MTEDAGRSVGRVSVIPKLLNDWEALAREQAATIQRLEQECALKQQKYSDCRAEATKQYALYEEQMQRLTEALEKIRQNFYKRTPPDFKMWHDIIDAALTQPAVKEPADAD